MLKDRRLWLLAAFLVLFVGFDAGFNGWIYSYVRTSLDGGIALASTAASSFWLATMAGRLARVGPLRRFPDGPLTLVSCLSGLCAVVLLFLVRMPVAAVVASVWLGLSMSTIYPTAMGLGQQLRPEESVAVVSLLGMASATGSLTLPWLHGQFLSGGGEAWPLALLVNAMLVLGLAIAVTMVIVSKSRIPALASRVVKGTLTWRKRRRMIEE
jgi:fucose permease